jgi:polyisoprenoid-binding protein YceI
LGKTMRTLLVSTALSLFVAAGAANATESPAVKTYSFDIPHTQVHFTVNHLGFSNSTGRMKLKEGTLDLSQGDLSFSSVRLTLDVASLDYGDATWNEHMRDAKFFDTAKHPTATFVSTKITMKDKMSGTMLGDLTLLGVKKPVTLSFTVNKMGENPFSKKPYIGISATGTLKRSDFGMTAYLPNVGDEASLRIEAEAVSK